MKFGLLALSAAVFSGANASIPNGAPRMGPKMSRKQPARKLDTKKVKLEQDFMRAMFADGSIMEAKRKHRENERKRKLMDKLMDVAIPRHLADNSNEYSFDDAYEWMNPVYQQMIQDGVFDLTARAFKYSGCAAIKAFDPEMAGRNGNPMVVDTYAVFRLCPEDSCNKYSLTGCGKNYGEYVVEMSTYLEFMLEFYEDHYGAFCDYCYPCDYVYQVQKRQTQGSCYEAISIAEYNQQQVAQQMAWEDYYQANYGDMAEFNKAKAAYEEAMEEQMNAAYQQKEVQSYGQTTSSSSYSSSNTNSSSTNNNGGNSNGYYANYMNYANGGNGNGNRKLEDSGSSSGGYFSKYMSYANGDGSSSSAQNNNAYSNAANNYASNGYGGNNNNQGSSAANVYGWLNSGQAGGQAYYNMMNVQQNVNGYGYYNENGEYIDICGGDGFTDSNGQTYKIDCDEYESKMMQCSDGSLCDPCEYQVDQSFNPCDEYVCKDYYTYCTDLYEPNYKTMYNENRKLNQYNYYAQNYDRYRMQNTNYNMQQYYGEDFNTNPYYYMNGGGGGGSNYNYQKATQESQQNGMYQFLTCTEYVNEYGQQFFVGPHCGSDHYTISLGVFADENCVDYLGETISMSKVLGYGYDEESFFHLPHECISCDGATQFADDENRYNEMYYGEGAYGEYVAAPNEEFDDVVAMCAALFERSAQCNIHMNNYEMMSKYMENIDAEFEQRYCNFIDNIVFGSYDESGEIKLKADTFDLGDWRNPEQYKKLRMPAGQAVGLALSILLVVALSSLAFITQRSLTSRGKSPWRPKRLSSSGPVERSESGVYLGRSHSGVSTSGHPAPSAANPPLI